MNTTELQVPGHHFITQIAATWPELDAGHLAQMADDRAALAAHVADTYHLTQREADEVLDEWVWRLDARAPEVVSTAA